MGQKYKIPCYNSISSSSPYIFSTGFHYRIFETHVLDTVFNALKLLVEEKLKD